MTNGMKENNNMNTNHYNMNTKKKGYGEEHAGAANKKEEVQG